ncbi:MAG: hypothetical protein COV67_13835 [Nitrospinae bacterium CG11_big_fil_rev_8_21_14_0_20_56_8]|nr:MAG: hypothetical protein COV67_13835 [Nitrospinae bacterium CG11_big_fil_rev_8_21_14_0_20_56_8]
MKEIADIEGATVLLTGATGFIGSHLADALSRLGCKVHCVVRPGRPLRWLDPSRAVIHRMELEETSQLRRPLEQADYLFHCAGQVAAQRKEEYTQANVTACRTLYEACRRYGSHLRAAVHLSSLAAVGPADPLRPVDETTPCHPVTHYGTSKKEGEDVALEYSSSLPLLVVRPPVVYGPRETQFFTYLKTLNRGWFIKAGSRPQVLSLICVHDLVEGMIKAALNRTGNEERIYFLTDGAVYDWDHVARTAAEIFQVTLREMAVPEVLLSLLAGAGELYGALRGEPFLFDRQRLIDIRQSAWTACAENFFSRFDFRPRFDLATGLGETIAWYKQQGWL